MAALRAEVRGLEEDLAAALRKHDKEADQLRAAAAKAEKAALQVGPPVCRPFCKPSYM